MTNGWARPAAETEAEAEAEAEAKSEAEEATEKASKADKNRIHDKQSVFVSRGLETAPGKTDIRSAADGHQTEVVRTRKEDIRLFSTTETVFGLAFHASIGSF